MESDRTSAHGHFANLGLDVCNCCSIRELRLSKATREVWWRNALQESLTLLRNVLLCDISYKYAYVAA